jgi:hypothetical protein
VKNLGSLSSEAAMAEAKFMSACVQNPVYMVFACLVADQDLLFVLYDVPCISICRAEQRLKALERLGMPATVYREIEERGGSHVVGVPLPGPNVSGQNEEEGDDRSLVDIWKNISRSNEQRKEGARAVLEISRFLSISSSLNLFLECCIQNISAAEYRLLPYNTTVYFSYLAI